MKKCPGLAAPPSSVTRSARWLLRPATGGLFWSPIVEVSEWAAAEHLDSSGSDSPLALSGAETLPPLLLLPPLLKESKCISYGGECEAALAVRASRCANLLTGWCGCLSRWRNGRCLLACWMGDLRRWWRYRSGYWRAWRSAMTS